MKLCTGNNTLQIFEPAALSRLTENELLTATSIAPDPRQHARNLSADSGRHRQA
jgi:hypothetical protein